MERVAAITCEAEAKKKDPGPQHKYILNYQLVEPRRPFMVKIDKSIGRDQANGVKAKKSKTPGPCTYDTEKAIRASSAYRGGPINIPLGGGVVESAKPDIKHQDKLKIKSTRFLDLIVKKAKQQGPALGGYQNLEKAFNKVASLPPSLKARRH